jgi:RNA polymerase sigma-70 factor (ECF subfamily)
MKVTTTTAGAREWTHTGASASAVHGNDTLSKARSGDHAAFGAIVRRHQSMVFSIAVHALRNPTAAEDLAQEVFLELYRSLGRIESETHTVAWLRRVTSHRCIDELRRARHRRELAVDFLPDRGESPRSREVFLEGRLQTLVARLPPRARMVMVLRYQEEMDLSDVAATLDMPVNTVKSHHRRSLAVLRAALLKENPKGRTDEA